MIWVGLVTLCVGFLINFIISDEHPGTYFGTALACIGSVVIVEIHHETVPLAMDVYQGKTTLEITYKDGVPVDSVVVFKCKEK